MRGARRSAGSARGTRRQPVGGRNEKEVGEAIARSGLDRSDVFVTSKLSNDAHRPDDARRAFDDTLKALGFDYIDMFLIHWPLPSRYDGDYVSTWQALEEFYREGRARSVGVSNSSRTTCAGCTPNARSRQRSIRSRSTRT